MRGRFQLSWRCNFTVIAFWNLAPSSSKGIKLPMYLCTTTTRAVRIAQMASSRPWINEVSDLSECQLTLACGVAGITVLGVRGSAMPLVVYVTRDLEYTSVYVLITYLNLYTARDLTLHISSTFTHYQSFHILVIRSDLSAVMRINWQKVS